MDSFHLAALTATLPTAVANVAFTAVQDDIITRSPVTGAFMLPEDMMLFAATAMSANMNRTRFSSASLRQINQPHIRPVIRSAAPRDLERVAQYLDQPWRLKANEELTLEGTSDIGAASELGIALLWFGKGINPVPPGDIITARATATTAAVVNTWTSLGMTLDQTLPPGVYALVGSECISTTGIAHRWIIPNQFLRPGFLSGTAIGNRGQWEMMQRYFGVLGQFVNTVLPIPQVLCTAADAAHTLFLQLIKVQ